jgi:hypothetical protein
VARAVSKTEEEGAVEMMQTLKSRGNGDRPPAFASDGKGSYREAMVEVWGQVPPYAGRGRPPTQKQAGEDWQLVKVVKERVGARLVAVHTQVVYGDPEEVAESLGLHTAYVERTNLTSRHMNGRLVRKSLSYSKRLRLLRASSGWEDGIYNLTRPVKSLRLPYPVEQSNGAKWQARTPMMAAGLTDHIWDVIDLSINI